MSTLRQASFPIPYFKVSPASEASREVANLYQGNKHSLTNAYIPSSSKWTQSDVTSHWRSWDAVLKNPKTILLHPRKITPKMTNYDLNLVHSLIDLVFPCLETLCIPTTIVFFVFNPTPEYQYFFQQIN